MEWFWALFHWHFRSVTLRYKENRELVVTLELWHRTWEKAEVQDFDNKITELIKSGDWYKPSFFYP